MRSGVVSLLILVFGLTRYQVEAVMLLNHSTSFAVNSILMNEWVNDYCLTPNEQFPSYFMARTSYFEWNDDEIRFVLDQHTELDFYNASSLKQQSAGRQVAPLEHIIMIPRQLVFVLSP